MKKSLPLAALAAVLAATGCGEVTQAEPGPGGTFYYPTGIGVADGKLLVASSNFDLRYDDVTGGSLISVDPEAGDALRGTMNIRSFAGELAVADAAACGLPSTLALVPIRGSNRLYRVPVAADGSLSCTDCDIGISSALFVDPFTIAVACAPGLARAYVGFLRSSLAQAWVTEVDLSQDPPVLRHRVFGDGRARDFAWDAVRQRIWIVGAGGISAPLRWVDVSGGCEFGPTVAGERADPALACRGGAASSALLPTGLELRSIAFANDGSGRAYVTARRYDPAAGATLGVGAADLGGVLLVVDLVEGLDGVVRIVPIRSMEIGTGAAKVRVLPARSGGRRDVVVALAAGEGVLWIYDDETGDRVHFGRDAITGAPAVGHSAFGLAVDPVPLPGNVGRVYVGSFLDSFVTPVDVPLDAPWGATIPQAGDGHRRITGGTP